MAAATTTAPAMGPFVIPGPLLAGIVQAASTLVDEIVLNFTETGLVIKHVDPAHVALIEVRVGLEAIFMSSDLAGREVLVDVAQLQKFRRVIAQTPIIHARIKHEDGKTWLDLGATADTAEISLRCGDPGGVPRPKVPVLAPTVRIETGVSAWVNQHETGILDVAGCISESIQLASTIEGVDVTATADGLGFARLLPCVAGEGAVCLSVDYFTSMLKGIAATGATRVRIEWAEESPARITAVGLPSGVEVSYLLAARLEEA
jgi:proliferating cell nuclear antigen